MKKSLFTRARIRRCAVLALAASVASAVFGVAPAQAATRRVSAWLPYWDQTRALESFKANAASYSSLSPFWYLLDSRGRVTAYSGAGSKAVLDAARVAGVPVIPTITNDFDGSRVGTMLASASSRSSHVKALTSLVTSNGYAGVDVDYESLSAADRSRFSTFVRDLASSLHAAGKKLSVTVHPKTSEPGTWDGPQAQDYAAIGAAADVLRPMAYDYHWSTSAPGSIAPASWVDQVARFASSVVPAAKVQLGMPLYGYDWVGSQGTGVTFDQVAALQASTGASRRWSSADQEPWFTYVRSGVTHTVWYEDAASIAAKWASVDRYGLGGGVFWRLGGEDPAVWPAVAGSAIPAPPSTADATAPVPTIVTPKPNTTLGSPGQVLSFTASDAAGAPDVRIFLDGRLVARATAKSGRVSVTTASLRAGRHLIRVDATDATGNRGVANAFVYRR